MMKCYEYEYNVGNSPDTELMFVYAESDEEAASALSAYGDEVTANDLSEVDTNGRYFKAWARRYGRRTATSCSRCASMAWGRCRRGESPSAATAGAPRATLPILGVRCGRYCTSSRIRGLTRGLEHGTTQTCSSSGASVGGSSGRPA